MKAEGGRGGRSVAETPQLPTVDTIVTQEFVCVGDLLYLMKYERQGTDQFLVDSRPWHTTLLK